MFLKKLSKPFKKLSYRLAFAFLIFFIPSYVIIFGAFDFLASRHLEKKDRDQIENQLQVYQDLFEKEGVEGLKKIIKNPRLHSQSMQFLIYVSDQENKTLYLHLPEDRDRFEVSYIEKKITDRSSLDQEKWFYIPSVEGDDDALEVRSANLPNGFRLLVGASTDDKDELLESFRKIFIAILTPLILISIFGAIFISQKMLRPLLELTGSIKEIKEGKLSSRAPLPSSQDELYDLTSTFNDMIHQIENLVQAMKETLDNIAHDLKTPLTRNRVSSEMALEKNSIEELKIAAEENIENTDGMLKIIQTILEVARLNSKTLRLNKENFNVKNLFDEIVDLYFFVAEEKKIQIEMKMTDFEMFADRSLMKQALANLIDNAIKYSKAGSSIQLLCVKSDDEVRISIIDSGIGIEEEDIPRIWERLYRADRSRNEPGLGLGLSMVKVFVESHGGHSSVRSQLDVGSEFILTLPT